MCHFLFCYYFKSRFCSYRWDIGGMCDKYQMHMSDCHCTYCIVETESIVDIETIVDTEFIVGTVHKAYLHVLTRISPYHPLVLNQVRAQFLFSFSALEGGNRSRASGQFNCALSS